MIKIDKLKTMIDNNIILKSRIKILKNSIRIMIDSMVFIIKNLNNNSWEKSNHYIDRK
jgi:hypothetical protein